MMFVNIFIRVALISLKHKKYFQEQKQSDPIIPEQAIHLISVQIQFIGTNV